jgi:hypothetical protein
MYLSVVNSFLFFTYLFWSIEEVLVITPGPKPRCNNIQLKMGNCCLDWDSPKCGGRRGHPATPHPGNCSIREGTWNWWVQSHARAGSKKINSCGWMPRWTGYPGLETMLWENEHVSINQWAWPKKPKQEPLHLSGKDCASLCVFSAYWSTHEQLADKTRYSSNKNKHRQKPDVIV